MSDDLGQSGVSDRRYRTIVADPPWPLAWTQGPRRRNGHGTWCATPQRDLGYSTMTIEDIAALPIGNIADSNGAHLYLWTTDKQLLEGSALSVIISWGFVPYRTLIWRKASPALGSAWRSTHDACVVGRRGDLRFAPLGLPTVFDWKHPRANNKIHSAKPDGFLDMVEQVSPGPYVELFARRARFGWDYWGDQSLGTAEMAVAPSRGRSDA